MINKIELQEIAKRNNISFNIITQYRAELILLYNDKKSFYKVSKKLNNYIGNNATNVNEVNNWYLGKEQPKPYLIDILENWFFERNKIIC